MDTILKNERKMFEENNYYIKFVNNKKTTFEEAEAILEFKYKSSLENKKKGVRIKIRFS